MKHWHKIVSFFVSTQVSFKYDSRRHEVFFDEFNQLTKNFYFMSFDIHSDEFGA